MRKGGGKPSGLPPNVIKLSKNGAHKKYPPRKIEVGIFCFDK